MATLADLAQALAARGERGLLEKCGPCEDGECSVIHTYTGLVPRTNVDGFEVMAAMARVGLDVFISVELPQNDYPGNELENFVVCGRLQGAYRSVTEPISIPTDAASIRAALLEACSKALDAGAGK